MKKQFGANAGERKALRTKRTAATKIGGISNAGSHRGATFEGESREKNARKPAPPSQTHARKMPETLGPISMTGNIMRPVNFGIGS